MVNIFIANLDWTITSEDLKTTFSTFGDVHYAHVVYEKDTKRSKGFGYVEMESAEGAIRAIEALNGVEINGRAIDVKIASPKTNRPAKKEAPAKKPFGQKPKFSRGTDFSRGSQSGGQRSGGGSYSRDNNSRGGYSNSESTPSTWSTSGEGEVKRVLRPRRAKD